MATDRIIQDQRKHAMDALQRRFAFAKAEIFQQQQKNKKVTNVKDAEEHDPVTTTCIASSQNAPITPSVNTPSKKGVETNDPVYSKLFEPVHENLLTSNVKFSGRKGNVVDKILNELLQNGDSAQKYMQGSRSMKIDNWIQLDSYVPKQSLIGAARSRALKSHSKRSRNHMSMKKHKKCGTFHLPQNLHKFDRFKPMHETWKVYMTKLLKTVGKNQLAQCLLSAADLHGAIILVAECKITDFTGVNGIMIRETAETLG